MPVARSFLEAPMIPNLPPLPSLPPRAGESASTPATAVLECHPERSGGGSGAVNNSGSPDMAVQIQHPAAMVTVSGERAGGSCAAVDNVFVGGSPQNQLCSGLPRDVFPGSQSLPSPAGPPPGRQEGQLRSSSHIDVTIR